MLDPGRRLDELQNELRRAQVVTSDLMSRVVADVRARDAIPNGAARLGRIKLLIETEAWTEAALALVELGLPQWKLRRLVYDDGAWLCSLSKQWNLPEWLGESVEVRHESFPLAILCALIEARQCGGPPSRGAASSVPRVGARFPLETVCCDNFA
jgi:hypothetical protein